MSGEGEGEHLHPGIEQSGDVEAEEAAGEAGEGELVVRHHPVDRVVHAAVGPSQRQPGTEDGAQRRIHDGQQLEAHDEGGDDEVERLHPLRGAGRGAGVETARGRGAARRRLPAAAARGRVRAPRWPRGQRGPRSAHTTRSPPVAPEGGRARGVANASRAVGPRCGGGGGTAEVLIERQLFVKKSSSRSRMRSMFTLSCVRSAFLSAAGGTPRGGGWTGRGAGSGRRRRQHRRALRRAAPRGRARN